MFAKIKILYKEYPNTFKVLTLATFIDMLGNFLLFPFYSLYITSHFGVTMVEVGYLLAINAVGNIFGSLLSNICQKSL